MTRQIAHLFTSTLIFLLLLISDFSLHISCVGNTSEIATLRIGFTVTDSDGKAILGMPLAIDLKKECRDTSKTTFLNYLSVFS